MCAAAKDPHNMRLVSVSDEKEPTQVELHPVSEHRTPREIAKDEAGPIGKPDLDTVSKDTGDEKAKKYPAAHRTSRAEDSK